MGKTERLEHRGYNTVFSRSEGSGRLVEGYAAVFNSRTDLGWFEEEIAPGAFDNAIGKSDVRALFNHNENYLLARSKSGTLNLSIDGKGLKYSFEAPNTSAGNDLIELIERGDLAESSFAFTISREEWKTEERSGRTVDVRTILEVERLYDVSPVTYPAYQDTTVAKRSFEEAQKESHPVEDDLEEETIFKENESGDAGENTHTEEGQDLGYPVELARLILDVL